MSNILVIDDEKDTVDTLLGLLWQYDVHVDYVSSTKEAIESMLSTEYDAIITDYDIDEHKGVDILRFARGIDTEGLESMIKGNFRKRSEYDAFVQENEGTVYVLFSSNKNIPDHNAFDGVYKARKNNENSHDNSAENQIISYLEDQGILTEIYSEEDKTKKEMDKLIRELQEEGIKIDDNDDFGYDPDF